VPNEKKKRGRRGADIEVKEMVAGEPEEGISRALVDSVEEQEKSQTVSKRPDRLPTGALSPGALRAPYSNSARSRKERYDQRYSVLSQIWLDTPAAITKGHVRVTPPRGRERGGEVGHAAPSAGSAEVFYIGEWCGRRANV
jgi:hypothetical protein